ncbi:Mediator complex, subunit med13, partial [Globisporangium splendens]
MGLTDDDDSANELLSYGSPRRSFSVNLSRAGGLDSSAAAATDGDAQHLLAFYRQRCEQFQQERQTMLDRMTQIEISKEEFHRLKWELRMKNEEISELEDSLKKSSATLFQVKTELVDMQAENKKLRIQEEKDRQKIHHLLALTQPVTEEVCIYICPIACGGLNVLAAVPALSVRDPGCLLSRLPSWNACVLSDQPYANSPDVHVPVYNAYIVRDGLAATSKEPTDAVLAHESSRASTLSSSDIEQSAEDSALLDEFANEKAKLAQQKQQTEDKAQLFERQLEKSQRLLHQTTKDYLVLRHQSQEAERLAHEELHQMQEKCETLMAERKEAIQQAVVETQALKRSIQEEGNVYAQEFRNQAQSRERDLHILKEQYAAVQEACTHRIQDLQARLTKLRSRYRSLDKRRAMEMEGFTRDITALKRHLQKLEVMHYGRRLTVQERQNLRLDEHFTLDSNELSEEVAALQHRVMELAADLADVIAPAIVRFGSKWLAVFAGDTIFLASSVSLGENDGKPSQADDYSLGILRYPPEIARSIGFYQSIKRQRSAGPQSWRGSTAIPCRSLAAHPRGVVLGKITLVDFQNAPSQLVRTADISMLEFVVQDALTFLKPREMKVFLERQLRTSCMSYWPIALPPAAMGPHRALGACLCLSLKQQASTEISQYTVPAPVSMETTQEFTAAGGSDKDVTTNVFPLCTLALLEWRVYGADTVGSHAGGVTASTPLSVAVHEQRGSAEKPVVKKESDAPVENSDNALLDALFLRLQQQNSLVVKESERADDGSDAPRVWLFMANHSHQQVPTADTLTGIIEVTSGEWRRSAGAETEQLTLDAAIQTRFFRALNARMGRQLLANADFVLDKHDYFQLNDAKFIYRCPSLSLLNHFDIYLDEDFPTPAFQLHFQLMMPSHLLCVTVSMIMNERFARRSDEELGNPHSSWQRLLGLPCANDHSMVDVWHLDDGLVPRIIAETKYSDVFARFRAVAKRKSKRKSDDGDGSNEGDDGAAKKPDENDDDGDDDEDDATHDGDGDGDELRRRVTPGKKRRKKTSTDPAENDESITPVSPDTHVNTPDASGPTIRATFPRDADALLHCDAEVHHFKRRRSLRQKKKSNGAAADFALVFGPGSSAGGKAWSAAASGAKRQSVTEYTNLAKWNGVAAAPMLSRKNSLAMSGLPTAAPQSEGAKPTLSVAVSLVASLSHDEQQEALDGRPTKTHPLLAALQSFVENEFSSKMEARNQRALMPKQRFAPSAKAYVSTQLRKPPVLLGVNDATTERLRNNLLSDRFKAWAPDYSPHKTKQQKKERQRQLLLQFDESKLDEYSRQQQEQRALQNDQQVFKSRDEEIAFGIQMAASDALVVWRQASRWQSRWLLEENREARVVTTREKQNLADRVRPHLLSLCSVLNGRASDGRSNVKQWLNFGEYARQHTASNSDMNAPRVPEVPKFCVSTMEAGLHVEPQVISEYLLRGFHPVAAPKPVDYAIVCPHSPSEWLGVLTLSYLTCFRSMYAQCHMGDHAPIDLSQVNGNSSVSVDAVNTLLLVECATSASDAFATYRSAGELLSPVLCNGVKKKQAFSRSAVANVIYVVVPFRRQDVKHKMWTLGAFSHGLFGSTSTIEVPWRESVTIELLYLEDLYEVGVNPSPYALMPSCFALYDRVFESVNLKPIVTGNDQGASSTGKSRYVSERLYHLADTATGKAGVEADTCVYGGYAVSADQKWIACSFVDNMGSILGSCMIPFDKEDLESVFLEMMKKWLDFLALFGEKSSLVICRLGESQAPVDENELRAWRELSTSRAEEFVPAVYKPLLTEIKFANVTLVSSKAVQVRENDSSMLYQSDTSGYLVVSPHDRAGGPEGSRGVCSSKGLSSVSVSRAHSGSHKEPAIVSMSVIFGQLLSNGDADAAQLKSSKSLTAILDDFYSLSYLTMHPMTMERQSPLPLHLAVVDKLKYELSTLATQLQTDPLQLRQ